MNCQEVLIFRMRTATLHVSGLDAVSDTEAPFCWLVPCFSCHSPGLLSHELPGVAYVQNADRNTPWFWAGCGQRHGAPFC
jgi:hypothetical protein